MKTITFTEFRQKATSCFDEVEKGEKIRVLRHGRPIADIVPVAEVEAGAPSWKLPGLKLTVKGASLSEAILQDREQAEG